MEINEDLLNRVENKTKVKKESIFKIASSLNEGNMKDKDTLLGVIDELSSLTGKYVSEEKKEKIINMVINDKIPSNIDKMF